MEFRKTVMITLYARQQKRHRCIERFFGLCGRARGWDDLGEWHWNMCNIICEMICQSRCDAWDRVLGACALGWRRGMVWGGRREEGSGWGTHVYLWWIHVDIWQNKCNIVKLNKIKLKKKSSHRITWSQNIQRKNEKKSYNKQVQKLQREIDIFHSVTDRTSWQDGLWIPENKGWCWDRLSLWIRIF